MFKDAVHILKGEDMLQLRIKCYGPEEGCRTILSYIQLYERESPCDVAKKSQLINTIEFLHRFLCNLQDISAKEIAEVGQALSVLGVALQLISMWYDSLDYFIEALSVLRYIGILRVTLIWGAYHSMLIHILHCR